MNAAMTALSGASVADALRLGRAAFARVREPEAPSAWLVCAACEGDAIVRGRWQRGPERALRRATGGPAWRLGEGTLYVALALRDASSLVDTPADKILNRNVRGMLSGMRALGPPLVYGGRELLSSSAQVVGLVGWTRAAGRGAVLLEAVIALDREVDGEPADSSNGSPAPGPTVRAPRSRPVPARASTPAADSSNGSPAPGPTVRPPRSRAVPTRASTPAADPTRFAGMPVATLARTWGRAPRAEDVMVAITRGYESLGKQSFERRELDASDDVSLSDPFEDDGTRWSTTARVPIGELVVGAHGDAIALRGDLFQEEDAGERLAEALRASSAPRDELDAIVARVFARGGAVIEGVGDVSSIARAVREVRSLE